MTWPASLCLFIDFLMFTGIWIGLAWFASLVWINLDIPNPAQFAKESTSKSTRSSRKKQKERKKIQEDQVPVIKRKEEHTTKVIPPLSAEDLPQNNNNMTSTVRQPKTVARLRNTYSNEQPPSFETSAERRRNYISSSIPLSYKSAEPDSGNWQNRYAKDSRRSSPLTRSGSSGGDYSSYPSARPSAAGHRSNPRTSSESYSRRTPSDSTLHGAGSSYTPPSSRHRTSDSGNKYTSSRAEQHKRPGTESGYGSLERDKIKRTGKTATPLTHSSALPNTDTINCIRDKYLGGKTTNEDVDRSVHSPTTRSHLDYSTHQGAMVATTPSGSSRLVHQNSLPSSSDTEDSGNRSARIAKYKEQRRKELAQKYGLGTAMIPSTSDSDYASRAYRYNRQSSLKSDGEESDRSVRSTDERTDRYRKYSHDASVSTPKIGRETDSGMGSSRQGHASLSKDALRQRSMTEPPEPGAPLSPLRNRSESASTTASNTKVARKDSVISQETQQLIENLEASRAARRERLRRSESEARDDADKIIAKHRARYGSESDKEVFSPSPVRKTAPVSLDNSPIHKNRSASSPPRTSTSTPPLERRQAHLPSSSKQSIPKTQSATEGQSAANSTTNSETKYTMPERKSRSSEGSESGETSDQFHKSSARNRRSRRMNVSISKDELKEAHKLQELMSPGAVSDGDDVFTPSVETIEQVPTPIAVIPEEAALDPNIEPTLTGDRNGQLASQAAGESRNKKISKPTAKVEPVKKATASVVDDSHSMKEHEKRRSRRRTDQSDSTTNVIVLPSRKAQDAHRSSPTPHPNSQRPKSPTKGVRDSSKRPVSPTKDVSSTHRRPTSPIKGLAERKPSTRVPRTDKERTPLRAVISTSLDEPNSSTKIQHVKPDIPQVLKQQSMARTSSLDSNSSTASEGKRSPSRKVSRVSSKDSVDLKGSPAGSPKHKALNREPSARLLELSKPRRTPNMDSDRKSPIVKLTPSASPKNQPKMRMSKEAERRLKTSRKPETMPAQKHRTKVDEKLTSEEEIQKVVVGVEKSKPVPRAHIVASTVTVEEQLSKSTDTQDTIPKPTQSKVDESDGFRTPLMESPIYEHADSAPISPVSLVCQEQAKSNVKNEEPEDIKKQALAKKDSDLIAMMKVRAKKLDIEIEEKEKELVENLDQEIEDDMSEGMSVASDIKPELPVPVTHRLRAFQMPSGTKPPKAQTKSKTKSPTTSPTRSLMTSPTKPKSQIKSSPKSPPLTPARSPTRSPIRSPPWSPKMKPQILPDMLSSPVHHKTPEDTEEEEDQLSQLSVSEKMRMFKQLQEKRAADQAAIRPKRRQYRRVRSSDRSQTQPVTPEELSEASHIAKEMAEKAISASQEKLQEIIEEEKEDELSKLSLSEKMKLFHEKGETKVKPLPKMDAPRRRKRSESRYKTQPVTIEEVKKAATFSPLARCFQAPPDPRVLASMPIADQISLVFGDNSDNTIAVQKSSSTEHLPKGTDSELNLNKKSILKQSSLEKVTPLANAGILKTDTIEQTQNDTRSILKAKDGGRVVTNVAIKSERMRSILKEPTQFSTESEDTPGILRLEVHAETSKEPDSILKKETAIEKPIAAPGILRKDLSEGQNVTQKGSSKRGILRKEDSTDADAESGTDEQLNRRKGASALSSSEHPRLRREKAGIVDQSESESDPEPQIRVRSALVSSHDSNIAAKAVANKKKSARITGAPTERYKTQPISSPTKSQVGQPVKLPTAKTVPHHLRSADRRQTQPVTTQEIASVKRLMEPVKTSGSIAERLSELKHNGEETWKNRIKTYEDSPTSGPSDKICMLNNNHKNGNETPKNISERLKLLQSYAENSWKNRVEEKDVKQFTVEGKMTKAGKEMSSTNTTPVAFTRTGSFKNRTRGGSFRKRVNLAGKDEKKDEEDKKSTSQKSEESPAKLDGFTTSTTETSTTDTSESEPEFKVIQKKVAIMKPDDDKFSEFFSSNSTTSVSKLVKHTTTEKSSTVSSEFEMSVSDFDAITDITKPRLQALSTHRRSLRPQRRVKPSKNPMRALKLHQAVLAEYTEERVELAEVESKTDSKNGSKSNSVLHETARRGLASKEDLKNGIHKLSKVKDVTEMKGLSKLLPYSDLMLIQIKGRRFVQVRLVEPRARSLNSGDCYVLVTSTQLFLWMGEYANVIEKSKSSEIAQHIQTKRDLGCKASEIIIVQECRADMNLSRNWKKFMKVLGEEEDYTDVGGPDEDEMHEIYITDTNMVYKLEGESLVPYDDFWGAPPKYNMLGPKELIVFDFGSELYIWNGKHTTKEQRKNGVKLAQLIWERGYDYMEYDVNPVCPGNKCPKSMKADKRPEWALFCKANQHMETILFSSKFLDWPDESRLIKTKRSQDGQDKEQKNEPAAELVAFDAKLMIQPSLERPHLILEGTNLGRGTGMAEIPSASNGTVAHFDKIERRGNHITTLSVVVWHILEYEHSIMPNECFGQFHGGDTYVVRWQYRVESIGMRDLRGNLSKRGVGVGRERCAYFFWQGIQSTINEKGASALMTVELDDERGPQRQVIQGKEPAAFMHLFQGRMVQHIGKREEEETNTNGSYRLYTVRGEHIAEGFLLEVECSMSQLRSRGCYVLLDLKKIDSAEANICVWYGAKVSQETRVVALHCANEMLQYKPMESGLNSECSVTLHELEEGKENRLFRQALGENRHVYDSAIDDPLEYDYTPRLFHLSSASGMFLANEVLSAYRSEEHAVPYPFFQSDIYGVHQPAQFLFDNNYEVYLWQGWWDAEDNETEGSQKTGSARRRWNIERRCAMETVMAYCTEKRSKNPPKAYLVHAGLEPLTFVNLFPFWQHREDVANINKQEGKQGNYAVLVKDALTKLTKQKFTLQELQERPLPEGVDPLILETYLIEEEFESVLELKKSEFYELPSWKQIDMKKRLSLF